MVSSEEGNAFNYGLAWGGGLGILATSIFWMWMIQALTVPKITVIEHKAAYYHPETGEFTWRYEENPHVLDQQ